MELGTSEIVWYVFAQDSIGVTVQKLNTFWQPKIL